MYGFHGFPQACNTRGDLAEEVAGTPRLVRMVSGDRQALRRRIRSRVLSRTRRGPKKPGFVFGSWSKLIYVPSGYLA